MLYASWPFMHAGVERARYRHVGTVTSAVGAAASSHKRARGVDHVVRLRGRLAQRALHPTRAARTLPRWAKPGGAVG